MIDQYAPVLAWVAETPAGKLMVMARTAAEVQARVAELGYYYASKVELASDLLLRGQAFSIIEVKDLAPLSF